MTDAQMCILDGVMKMINTMVGKDYKGKFIVHKGVTDCGIFNKSISVVRFRKNKIDKCRYMKLKLNIIRDGWCDRDTIIRISDDTAKHAPEDVTQFFNNVVSDYENDIIHEAIHVLKNKFVHSKRFYRYERRMTINYQFAKLLAYHELTRVDGKKYKLPKTPNELLSILKKNDIIDIDSYYRRVRRATRKMRDINNMDYMGGVKIHQRESLQYLRNVLISQGNNRVRLKHYKLKR